MKKIWFSILVILVLSPAAANAKTSKYITIGTTRATLRYEGGKSEWGKYVGFGLEYSNPYSLILGIEAAYATKKVTLENKSWPTDFFPEFSDVFIGNIDIHGSFLELAMKIGYYIPIIGDKISIKIYTGPTVSTQLKYTGSIRADSTIFLDPDEYGHYKFDYIRDESERLPESSFNYVIGVTISYKSLGAEVRIARAIRERKGLWALNINDKIDCFHILLNYAF